MKHVVAIALLSIGLIATQSHVQPPVRAAGGLSYSVAITNLTHAQSFTPILAATHSSIVRMFLEGTKASPELRALAEGGDVAPLTMLLSGTAGVRDIKATAGLLLRGRTTRLEITADPGDRLSLAAMLIPTNDGFMGINVALPATFSEPMVVYAYAYDAGTERNDELCASIPGPSFSECGGPGGGATGGGGEGGIVVHRGMMGTGDFDATRRDWKNPVARVIIRRTE